MSAPISCVRCGTPTAMTSTKWEIERRGASVPVDTEKIQWQKVGHEGDHAWSYVARWLDDFGVSFPAADAYAVLDSERTAFRIDSIERGKPVSIVVVATVDHDADGTADGWHNLSRAVRVEVIRC